METERRVERPSQILRPLYEAYVNNRHLENWKAVREGHMAILDQLHASQLRADKLLTAIATAWASPGDVGSDMVCEKASRAYLDSPESQSQTAVSEWPKWFKAWDTYILRVDANGAFMWGRHCTTVSELTLDSHEVRAAMIGQENWSPSIHEEAIRLVPLVAAKYPIASPPAKAVEPASESAEDWAARIVPESDSGARIYSHESGGGGTSISPRCEQLLPEWRAVARQHIANALRAYAASERDALKLRAEELAKELEEANHMLACNRREVTRLSEAAQTNHADRRELAKMNASLHGKLMRINDALMNPPLVTPPEPTNAS